jgi:hypothetical protein
VDPQQARQEQLQQLYDTKMALLKLQGDIQQRVPDPRVHLIQVGRGV